MLNVHKGNADSKETVKKKQHTINKLSRELTKIDTELTSSISSINNKVKRIHKEYNPDDFQPYYLRRRPSMEHLMEFSAKHSRDPSPHRNRSASHGSKPRGKIGSVSSNSQESVSSVGKSSDVSNSSSRDPSPSRKVTNVSFSMRPRANTNISDVIKATRYGGGRRMSLPMSFSPPYSNAPAIESPSTTKQRPLTRESTNIDFRVSENITTHLRRMQIDLHARVPKSIRQLRQNSMTSAEELIEEQIENEERKRQQSNAAADKFISELENCGYLRCPSAVNKALTVEEVFH
ncbi:hypothetical protein FSP39_004514 [Pinctada imbricata]|uniref:Uncharacterized protein n=1 Tax=Pinctada imbricata TaxID=66713 RepID=A0AA88XKW9_PINIB|nr:hypothetical protein FSP39_004514 [Pinctada imbricata]